jgi:hypothetical protein
LRLLIAVISLLLIDRFTPMSPTAYLEKALEGGVHRMGEIEMKRSASGILLYHHEDGNRIEGSELERFSAPDCARELSTYSADGAYRFAKAQTNLRKGWLLQLASVEEVRRALDLFYPASLGILAARENGTLIIQHLRDKLDRQTGMYRSARHISDDGAQRLVRTVCGPAHQCARRILWQIDANTPLEDSEASRYSGIPKNLPESEALPLLCREACNHFVSECRKASKEEARSKQD